MEMKYELRSFCKDAKASVENFWLCFSTLSEKEEFWIFESLQKDLHGLLDILLKPKISIINEFSLFAEFFCR